MIFKDFSESNYFAEMCVEAAYLIKVTDASGKILFPIKAINVFKAHGKSAKECRLIQGYALNCTVASQGETLHSHTALLAILNLLAQR